LSFSSPLHTVPPHIFSQVIPCIDITTEELAAALEGWLVDSLQLVIKKKQKNRGAKTFMIL
jgi:hypothetical protein